MPLHQVSVVKIGGSVLTGPQAYRRVAAFIGERLCAYPGERIVVVVSARQGMTDALLEAACDIAPDPDPCLVDLLWSTGETESAALLALSLQALGVRATAANIQQTGLVESGVAEGPGQSAVRPLRLRALLDEHDVIVAPGFLARGAGDRVISLGRGGSDLTAVLLAAGLGAVRCELVKDVPGYFTGDPKRDPDARPLEHVTYARAIEMADAGCELVQRHALLAARDRKVPLVVRALGNQGATIVSAGSEDPAYTNAGSKDPAYSPAGSEDPAYSPAGSEDPAYL
jgi:aspartokinase